MSLCYSRTCKLNKKKDTDNDLEVLRYIVIQYHYEWLMYNI